MKIKKYLSEFGLSKRQKRVQLLIDQQVKDGELLITKIKNIRGKDQSKLPRSEWVPNEELHSWESNGGKIIEDLFGSSSEQIKSWGVIWKEDPPSSPYDKDIVDVHINRIQQINAHLAGLKNDPSLSRNAIERIKDQYTRHPVMGPLVAVASIIATILALAKGVYWLLETLNTYMLTS